MIQPLPTQSEGIEPMPSTTYKRRLLSAPTLDPLSQWLAEIGSGESVDSNDEIRKD